MQTSRHLWCNYSSVNKHLRLLLCVCVQCAHAHRGKVRNFLGTMARARVRAFVGGKKRKLVVFRRCSLVFTTFTDRLQHLHMKRIEQHFSSTTDTLWLSGPRWTGTTLAMTPHRSVSQSEDTKCGESDNHVDGGKT